MRLAIMQPYFFPYIGYWQLIGHAHHWVVFDEVKYNRKSWMGRNRILHPDSQKESQYISVPVSKHETGTLIRDVEINNDIDWRARLYGKLTVYRSLKAPHYDEVVELVRSIIDRPYEKLLDLCVASMSMICEYLSMSFSHTVASQIDYDRGSVEGAGDWALAISKHMKAKTYINPYGGHDIFDSEKYEREGIELKFLKPKLSPYRQFHRNNHVPGLSIIDVMMFNRKADVQNLVEHDFQILSREELLSHSSSERS